MLAAVGVVRDDGLVAGLDRVHIHCCGNGCLWFRSTAGHFFQAPKNNQKGFAPPLGASPRLGIHAEVPAAQHLRSAIVVNGAPEIKIKSEAA
jgi:hypothetical protein